MRALINLVLGWEEVYASQDMQSYMKVKSLLDNHDIRTKVSVMNSIKGEDRVADHRRFTNASTYCIDVKKDQLEEARTVLKQEL